MTRARFSPAFDKSAIAGSDTLLLEAVDLMRVRFGETRDRTGKEALGQFFTPLSTARLMASMVHADRREVRILDAGAGVGILFAACIAELTTRDVKPTRISVHAYEIDGSLIPFLEQTMALCRRACDSGGVSFDGCVVHGDFIEHAMALLGGNLFEACMPETFTCAILNPPYGKIHSQSRERKLLRQIGIETSNRYTGFLSAAIKLLDPLGEVVAITPRSFCNGPYFKPFRQLLLSTMRLQRLHVFGSREQAFRDDAVLQENIILHAIKSHAAAGKVVVSTSDGPEDDLFSGREIAYDEVVRPRDPQFFIHVVPDYLDRQVAEKMAMLPSSLAELGISVSTGRVVDFRARAYLQQDPGENTAPLIYPTHIEQGIVVWPKRHSRKPNALTVTDSSKDLLIPSDTYVLVKRFSSKEERRRVTAAVYSPERITCAEVGFENHLNYFHVRGKGLDPILARGLAAFLNSTLVDAYLRQFSGHTQVNATDLRNIRYPSRDQLIGLARRLRGGVSDQDSVDEAVKEELFAMAEDPARDPVAAKRRIEEAQGILRALGFPATQQNERSALTLLALLDLKPGAVWSEALNPLRGITPMMEFFRIHYGKQYAPNSRETVRRGTVHQFVDAGLAVVNPDDLNRPTNSGQTVYQIETEALNLLRSYGSDRWEELLQAYLATKGTLKQRYARARHMIRIPVQVRPGLTLRLSPGGQNPLVARLIADFGPLFTHGGIWLYIGDTGEKEAFIDREGLEGLGVTIEPHGKMPDIIIYDREKNRLLVIEAVSSHGPISPKHKDELAKLFAGSTATFVFVTAFADRKKMAGFLSEIDWDTEVWTADSPEHLIHFNGERFLQVSDEQSEEIP